MVLTLGKLVSHTPWTHSHLRIRKGSRTISMFTQTRIIPVWSRNDVYSCKIWAGYPKKIHSEPGYRSDHTNTATVGYGSSASGVVFVTQFSVKRGTCQQKESMICKIKYIWMQLYNWLEQSNVMKHWVTCLSGTQGEQQYSVKSNLPQFRLWLAAIQCCGVNLSSNITTFHGWKMQNSNMIDDMFIKGVWVSVSHYWLPHASLMFSLTKVLKLLYWDSEY